MSRVKLLSLPVLLLLIGCPMTLVDDGAVGEDEIDASTESDSTSETDTAEDTETSETVTVGGETDTGEPLNCGGLLGDIDCTSGQCQAQWLGSDAWSDVFAPDVVATWTPVDPVGLFPCEPDPSTLDGCGLIDDVGHAACWVWEGECARIAAPLCSVTDATETNVWPDWVPCDAGLSIGAGAFCNDQFCWLVLDPTTSIRPRCP